MPVVADDCELTHTSSTGRAAGGSCGYDRGMLLAFLSPSYACGGFVPVEGSLAASDAQQALFELGADGVSVTYSARYSGDAADFAWVIAVPGAITNVQEGDADRLTAIEEASAPQVTVDPTIDDAPMCGCGYGASKGGDLSNSDTGGVDVTGTGYAGVFEYTTLAASDADGLVTWLTDHGYDVSLVEAAVGEYVADTLDYEFVAVQLRPELAQAENVQLNALQIDYGAAADGNLHMVFPAKLGKTSSVTEVRTEIYVLATGTADISGWSTVANPDGYDIVGPDYVDPSGLYYQKLLETGGAARAAWQTYSGAYEDAWLTRYDSITYPATNIDDPVFTDSGVESDVSTEIYMQDEAAYERGDAPAWLFLGVLGLGVGWRRRAAAR